MNTIPTSIPMATISWEKFCEGYYHESLYYGTDGKYYLCKYHSNISESPEEVSPESAALWLTECGYDLPSNLPYSVDSIAYLFAQLSQKEQEEFMEKLELQDKK